MPYTTRNARTAFVCVWNTHIAPVHSFWMTTQHPAQLIFANTHTHAYTFTGTRTHTALLVVVTAAAAAAIVVAVVIIIIIVVVAMVCKIALANQLILEHWTYRARVCSSGQCCRSRYRLGFVITHWNNHTFNFSRECIFCRHFSNASLPFFFVLLRWNIRLHWIGVYRYRSLLCAFVWKKSVQRCNSSILIFKMVETSNPN